MEVWLWVGAAGAVIGSIIVYVALMIFFPEWVGITGKTAIENEKAHRSGTVEKDNDFIERLHDGGSKKQK